MRLRGAVLVGEVLRESRQEGLRPERDDPEPWGFSTCRHGGRGPASSAWHLHPSQTPGRACMLCLHSGSHRPSDLGEKPAGLCGGEPGCLSCSEGLGDGWPTHCFVLIQPILKRHVWRRNSSCLFWSLLRLPNEGSLVCCVAGVGPDSGDATVTRGVPPPQPCVCSGGGKTEALWGGPAGDPKRGFESDSARKMSGFWGGEQLGWVEGLGPGEVPSEQTSAQLALEKCSRLRL